MGVWVKSEGLEIRQAVQEVCQYQLNGDFKKQPSIVFLDITRTALYKAKHRFNTKITSSMSLTVSSIAQMGNGYCVA